MTSTADSKLGFDVIAEELGEKALRQRRCRLRGIRALRAVR